MMRYRCLAGALIVLLSCPAAATPLMPPSPFHDVERQTLGMLDQAYTFPRRQRAGNCLLFPFGSDRVFIGESGWFAAARVALHPPGGVLSAGFCFASESFLVQFEQDVLLLTWQEPFITARPRFRASASIAF